MGTNQEIDLTKLAEIKCEQFIEKEQPNLVTFTKESRLRYLPDTTIESIKWNLQQKEVYLPAILFLENEEQDQIILWHIYYELALYHEWQKYPELYLNRLDRFVNEINEMTTYLSQKIKELGMETTDLFTSELLVSYIKKELTALFFMWDKFYSLIRVFQYCPIYRQPVYKSYINQYLKKTYLSEKILNKLPIHQQFAKSFLLYMIDSDNQLFSTFENNPYQKQFLGENYFEFIYQQVVQEINTDKKLDERDYFFKAFIYPEFKTQWKKEIDNMLVQSQVNKEDVKGEWLTKNQDTSKDAVEMDSAEEMELLEALNEEKETENSAIKQLLDAKTNLTVYGVSVKDQEIYQYYINKTQIERREMTLFWEKLIGKAKKEVSSKMNHQVKGKLDIDSVITQYVPLSEAEKIGNYKNLALFNRYVLVPQPNVLPEDIEIIFLVDNSGSMNAVKIDAARKALAATLMSLEDFSKLLKQESIKTNQQVNLTSSTWFFGSHYYQVKDKGSLNNEKESQLIKSISYLNGQDGTTDDASCLREILTCITAKDESILKSGKKIQMIFEITDGASSFPGATKEVISQLIEKNVLLFAFQIGKNSESAVKRFDYVWNEWSDYERGIKLGEDIDKLTTELLTLVSQQMEAIWIG